MLLAVLSHYEPLWWEKIGKVANQVKLAVPSHSEPLLWEKIGKVVHQVKLAVPSNSEPLWWEKIGKVATWTKSNFSRRGGAVHQPEPQCHLDLKSNFIILGGGGKRYIASHSNLLQIFQSGGGEGHTSAGRSEKCKVYG